MFGVPMWLVLGSWAENGLAVRVCLALCAVAGDQASSSIPLPRPQGVQSRNPAIPNSEWNGTSADMDVESIDLTRMNAALTMTRVRCHRFLSSEVASPLLREGIQKRYDSGA